MNHLKDEKSPYLIQHRENPVDWYPWGEEAFGKALREQKPVFLSIGYSTCHWCHVMAHESFEDTEVAELLNRSFVPVKVDREERPDVDTVYMTVCQALTGGGGWPMTVLMTPDKKPFFAGTYFPKRSRYGMPGLMDLLEKTEEIWASDRNRLIQTGEDLVEIMNQRNETGGRQEPETLMEQGVEIFRERFDKRFGGFGHAPKFPAPHNLMFLLEYGSARGHRDCMAMTEKTLEYMARGGMFDQIGGGFSRYSTDDRWLVPHFEKMLYDNALLAQLYTQAYAITKKPFYREVVCRVLDYAERELLSPEGGFYCGQDADSRGEEGSYYLFKKGEIEEILGPDAEAFCHWFGITEDGNFEGRNIPNLLDNPEYERTRERNGELCGKVYEYRRQRMELHRDDKILTSWNAMMISACATAGFLFGNARFIEMARRAEQFIEDHLYNGDHRLMVRYRDGECAFLGNLEDYAYLGLALIHLYETTFEAAYLLKATKLADEMVRLFWNMDEGGFYFYGSDDEELIYRPRQAYDAAVPSGNSVAAHVLLWLSRLTGEERWLRLLDQQMDFLAAEIGPDPSGYSYSLLVFHQIMNQGAKLVCVSAKEAAPDDFLEVARKNAGNNLAAVYKHPGNAELLSEAAPHTEEYPVPESGTQYYLCREHTCTQPFSDVTQLQHL